ncbi:DMT family transporter [Thermococcus gorgonarius]|uniref:Permease n=1 Tax=Thermococcus gorgonarius TaxID=71997 RepID=A0A2Z2M8J5_THEGO|nr:DMT family transporter [Thermococcus gorgonarius]ASJ00722.1 permease [Thermococcus gorgonarius]
MNGTVLGVVAALASAFCWATATILVKVGMRSKSPVAVNVIRLYLVSLMYLTVLIPTGRVMEIINSSLLYLAVAFISAQFGFVIGDYFYFNALHRMGVSRTVPITSTYPLWTVLWASIFLGRRIGLEVYLGALLIVLAIIIVRKAEEEEHADPRGFIYALLAPVSWSIAITMMDWLTGHFNSLTLAGLRMFSGAIGVSVFLPAYKDEILNTNLRELAVLAGAAFSGLFLGQFLFVYSTQSVGSQVSAPVSAINPLLTSLMAVIFLKETPNRRIFEGLALAIVGILLVSMG